MDNQLARRDLLRGTICGAAIICSGDIVSPAFASPEQSTSIDKRSLGSFAVAVKRPRGLAIHGSRCYVAADEGVLAYDESGTCLSTWKVERPVRCVATRPDGEVLIGFAHHIERWSAEGRRLARWESFERNFLVHRLAVAGGLTYVAESHGAVIAQLDESGRIVRSIQLSKRPSSSLPELHSLTAKADGTFCVTIPSRYSIESYDQEGRLTHVFGNKSRDLAGFSGCCNPVDLSLLADGNLVTVERGQPRVKIYTARGEFVSLLAGPEQIQMAKPESQKPTSCLAELSVATDAKSRIAVLDQSQRRLHFFAG